MQKTEVEQLNAHIDWLLDNKKKLEAEISQLKSAQKAEVEDAPAPMPAGVVSTQIRQGSANARNAIILSEIISPPISKRGRGLSGRIRNTI